MAAYKNKMTGEFLKHHSLVCFCLYPNIEEIPHCEDKLLYVYPRWPPPIRKSS